MTVDGFKVQNKTQVWMGTTNPAIQWFVGPRAIAAFGDGPGFFRQGSWLRQLKLTVG